jgi:hypothetical protein
MLQGPGKQAKEAALAVEPRGPGFKGTVSMIGGLLLLQMQCCCINHLS